VTKQTVFYGTVERALATTYGIADERRPLGFRSMIANLQKLGALGPGARVGRGADLDYTSTMVRRLILALELCELGVPPKTVVRLLDRYWETKLKPIADAAARGLVLDPGGPDVFLCLSGASLRIDSLRGEMVPCVPHIDRWSPPDPPPSRALIVNLTARFRAFHAALAATAHRQAAE
jgi:hypothetical protein